jgi:hypothetical protein
MQVICLEEIAFNTLVEQVVARLKEQNGHQNEKRLSDEQAMKLLNVKSKTEVVHFRFTLFAG